MQSSPKLRMDGGKYFSTVHGERAPDDPQRHVHFFQDGLPFSAERVLLDDLIEGDEALMAKAAKKLARQKRIIVAAVPVDDGDSPQDVADPIEDDEEDDASDVNLEMWLTGEAKYIFGNIRAVIADRFKKRIISTADAVIFLASQGIVPVEKFKPEFKAMVAA